VGFSGGLYEIQGPFWKIMDCKHIFLKVQGFICKIMDCKHIFLKAWGLICKKWWTAVMIFAKWNIFFQNDYCSTIMGCPCGDPTVERGQRLFLGVQLICGKLRLF
jgi:hypothetical protein